MNIIIIVINNTFQWKKITMVHEINNKQKTNNPPPKKILNLQLFDGVGAN